MKDESGAWAGHTLGAGVRHRRGNRDNNHPRKSGAMAIRPSGQGKRTFDPPSVPRTP